MKKNEVKMIGKLNGKPVYDMDGICPDLSTFKSPKDFYVFDSRALRKKLSEGVVKFQYRKKDGSIRTTRGTTKSELIDYTGKNGNGPEAHGYIPYWDMDKNEWRCFNPSKLVAIL